TDLELEPVTLNGNGILPFFNGHFTGALRNVSGLNTYTGPLTLATDTTIGVDSGSSLTVGSKTGLLGTGPIQDDQAGATRQPGMEGLGTLILASANTDGGLTEVFQGALQVQHGQALGGTANGTDVFDGAQLQLQGNFTVAGESLTLSGTGINNTGALIDTGG